MNNSRNTINSTVNLIRKELTGIVSQHEIQSLVYIIFEEVMNFSKVDIYSKANSEVSKNSFDRIIEITNKLKQHMPVQYILGKTQFYGLPFVITPAVLIPRQETEELVDLVIKETGTRIVRIIDIGTGSGCIAVALNKNIFRSKVDAMDVSENVIKVAEENAFINNALINFRIADILKWEKYTFDCKYDIIVSNPPYVRESEKKLMDPNVLNYEPPAALFVSDERPLLYYEHIIAFAKQYLNENGRIYFEINENLSSEMKDMLTGKGFSDTELKKDINGKYRMISCGR